MTLLEWTPEKSTATEYLGKLLDRHNEGASESDIRMAFRDFLIRTGIAADESEISSETSPSADSALKVDLYIRNTYVEFKRGILTSGAVNADHIAQLDEYIMESARAGAGIQNGILTDGKNYLKRSVGDRVSPLAAEGAHAVFSNPAQGRRPLRIPLRHHRHGGERTRAGQGEFGKAARHGERRFPDRRRPA